MREFSENELCEMFSVGGCGIADGPGIVTGGAIADPNSGGMPFDSTEWQPIHRKNHKVRQYRENDGLSSAQKATLVEFHAARIAEGREHCGKSWREILGK